MLQFPLYLKNGEILKLSIILLLVSYLEDMIKFQFIKTSEMEFRKVAQFSDPKIIVTFEKRALAPKFPDERSRPLFSPVSFSISQL